MITTDELIRSLAADAQPLRRLRPPLQRWGLWLVFAAVIVAMLEPTLGVRADVAERLGDPFFLLTTGSALATGVLAALSTFMIGLPDRRVLWTLLPLPAMALWMSTIGYGCLSNWVDLDPGGIQGRQTAQCVATLVLVGTPLSLALLVMLRHVGRLRPNAVALCGGLAVSGITATALALFHDFDATILVLFWNLGTIVLFLALARLVGRTVLSHADGD